jgi:PBP1b-binding outer membrane lipoprotein LpoB
MKKVVLSIAFVAAVLVSCNKKAEGEVSADSTATVVDSAATVVDSAATVVDSAATVVDSAAAKVEGAAKEVAKEVK